ncbi:MAG TPA: 5-oxoprolinase subunit PxpB [Chloroflexi bacterium]|nr:5-oxoprolinase subunit PxpB [Chloroflexota bacterium]
MDPSVIRRILAAGDSALLVELGDRIEPAINRQVHALALALERRAMPGLGEIVPSYCSLLVHYDPLARDYAEVEAFVSEAACRCEAADTPAPREAEIPTVYGGTYGPDIAFVAAHNGLSVDDVIECHSGTTYTVYMLGFAPGFAYLGALPETLVTPRLSTPRQVVPAGSVGIAGAQTGVYPIETPGGWRLIGRTPVTLFDPMTDPPTRLRPGDQVQFVPISPGGFESRETARVCFK